MDEQTLQGLDLEKIQGEMKEKGEELLGRAVDFAREQPHLAVAAAFGIGWILGNGLSPKIVTVGARLGMKALLGGAVAGTGLAGILGGEGGGLASLLHRGEASGEEEHVARAPKQTRRTTTRPSEGGEGEASSARSRRNGNVE
jgi:hypothetical protein